MATMPLEILDKLLEELRTIARTETIMGKEMQVGEFTLIPVSRISLGVGTGGGKGSEAKKEGEGGGGGGGVVISPVGFIAIRGGEISFHGIKPGGALDGLFEHLPELAEKILAKQQEAGVQGKKAEPDK